MDTNDARENLFEDEELIGRLQRFERLRALTGVSHRRKVRVTREPDVNALLPDWVGYVDFSLAYAGHLREELCAELLNHLVARWNASRRRCVSSKQPGEALRLERKPLGELATVDFFGLQASP